MSIDALHACAADALRENDIDCCACPFLTDPRYTGYAQGLALFLKVGAGSDRLVEMGGQQTLRTAASASHGAAVRLFTDLGARIDGDLNDLCSLLGWGGVRLLRRILILMRPARYARRRVDWRCACGQSDVLGEAWIQTTCGRHFGTTDFLLDCSALFIRRLTQRMMNGANSAAPVRAILLDGRRLITNLMD